MSYNTPRVTIIPITTRTKATLLCVLGVLCVSNSRTFPQNELAPEPMLPVIK